MSNPQRFSSNVKSWDDVRRALDGVKRMFAEVGGDGTFNRVIADGETRTILDKYSAVAVRYLSIAGTGQLVLEGDAALEVL